MTPRVAALHRALAAGHRTLAETLEAYPSLAEGLISSSVVTRSHGAQSMIRAELMLHGAPAVERLEAERACPWLPGMLEAALSTGAYAIWPARRRTDLAEQLAAERTAERVIRRAKREALAGGDLLDVYDRLTDVHPRLLPGPLAELVEDLARAIDPRDPRAVLELLEQRAAA